MNGVLRDDSAFFINHLPHFVVESGSGRASLHHLITFQMHSMGERSGENAGQQSICTSSTIRWLMCALNNRTLSFWYGFSTLPEGRKLSAVHPPCIIEPS
ncbi:hypothetical protein TNCV_2719881 [Trichonephila clavipes]|nr:hypothetical protein TNCV_2719881 [Trichonephila clavipes]